MIYYNPFMPTRYLNPRASGLIVFGGGSSPAPAKTPAEIKAEKDAAAKAAAEKKAAKDAAAKKLADEKAADAKAVASYKASVNAAVQAAGTGLDAIGKAGARLQAANSVTKPGVTHSEYSDQMNTWLATKVEALQKEVTTAQEGRTGDITSATRDMTLKAVQDPGSLATKADVAMVDSNMAGTTIGSDVGQLTGDAPSMEASTVDTTATATGPKDIDAATISATTVTGDTEKALGKVEAEKGAVSDKAQVTAAEGTLSEGAMATGVTVDPSKVSEVISGTRSVSSNELASAAGQDAEAVKAQIAQTNVPDNIKAAQTSVRPEEIPDAAQIKESEMAQARAITSSGLSDDAVAVAAKLEKFSVDAGTLAEFKEGKIEAQDTVQGQIASLMQSFDDGTPVWAASALRSANAAMAARGLGSSSMAGAAIVQAAMESALPIAAADASAFREMKMGNLNRQQQLSLANAAAQQGVELNNFNAEQQTALQNSQNAFSLQSQNLSNVQQVMLANAQIKASLQGQNLNNQQQANLVEAARYAEVNNLNLNNRQQALLQDNSNALQVNLANMSSKQQAYLANAQLEAALQGKKIDNQQQVAMTNAARFAEANNLTFTAAEQAKIHNSDLLKTVGLAELNSEQAATLQNAAAIASMDMANLSNAQQAAVQNANAFLQMDMTNLTNAQQTSMFKAQAMQQSLLTDAAAENAAKQFNASSENQTNQFMATMATQVSQFNASQKNATNQFNAGQENAAKQFNANVENQRDQFNASNSLVVAQANAVWRQNTVTLNTAATNAANAAAAAAANEFTTSTLDQVWQRERDIMDYVYKASETSKDRALSIVLADKKYDEYEKARNDAEETAKWKVLTDIVLG